MTYLLSIEWNSIRLDGHVQGIVTKIIHKFCQDHLFVCLKLGPVQLLSNQISSKFTGEVVHYYLIWM